MKMAYSLIDYTIKLKSQVLIEAPLTDYHFQLKIPPAQLFRLFHIPKTSTHPFISRKPLRPACYYWKWPKILERRWHHLGALTPSRLYKSPSRTSSARAAGKTRERERVSERETCSRRAVEPRTCTLCSQISPDLSAFIFPVRVDRWLSRNGSAARALNDVNANANKFAGCARADLRAN